MNKLLIDTNVYSQAMAGDKTVISTLRRLHHIGISIISIGELLSGFKGGKHEKKNRNELNQFLDSPRVQFYSLDENSAEYYSAILNQLKKQGTPIPTNDIWIGATAFQQGLPVYTFDKHFFHIKGLILNSQ